MDWTAQWIWHPAPSRPSNFYLHARREFTLQAVPGRARLAITAGQLYTLHVNGQYVGRGPNPADPSFYYYDVHDVTAQLRPGVNVVAVTAYHYSDEPAGIIGQNWGPPGLLVELRDDADTPLLATNAAWRVIQAPEWDPDAPINCTLYADYKEHYDSRKELPGWREAGFDDGDWLQAAELGTPPGAYGQLIEREIPFLDGPRVYPENSWSESASVTYSWREDCEIYHNRRLVPDNPAFGGEKFAEITKTHDDFSPSIILDFGRDVTGYPEIEIHSGPGGVIDVLYGEDLHMVRVDRFILRGGPQTLQAFNRRTFRYMKLLFAEAPERIEIARVSVKMDTYPVEYVGQFACSDARLNRIWDVGRYTIHISMLDHFVDCPWRERTIYGGDVAAENLIAQYAFGDGRLNRKTLRQMFALQYDAGALPPYGPYRGCHGFYASWSAHFGLAFLDHWRLNADRPFLDELWPRFRRLLDWSAGEVETNEPHLIGRPNKGGDFATWSAHEKTHYSAWEVMPFYVLLRRGAQLVAEVDGPQAAQRYDDAADLMAQAIRTTMIDEQGLCQAHPHKQGARASQADNGYLLWAGLLNEAEGVALAQATLSPAVNDLGCPFQGLFLVEGGYAYGQEQAALDYIRRYWGDMLDRGATTFWEHFATSWPRTHSPGSYCHGWSAGPVYSLGAHVLGVQPAEPGFARVLIEPRPCDLSWAAGQVPTPQGPVAVRWNRAAGQFALTVQTPVAGRVSLPPAHPHATLTRNGQPVQPKRENGRLVVDISAGTHELLVTE